MPKGIGRFGIQTAAFCEIWNNTIKASAPASGTKWRSFVINVFERFTSGPSEAKNQAYMNNPDNEDAKGWKTWSDDQKYNFMSERCYSKAVGIRARLRKAGVVPVTFDLPDGYKERNPSAGVKRLTTQDIANIFNS